MEEQIYELLQEINNAVIDTIAERIRAIGKLTGEEVAQLNNLIRFYNEDIGSIEQEIAKLNKTTVREINRVIQDSATSCGEEIAKQFGGRYEENEATRMIVSAAAAKAVNDFLNISQTTVMRIDGVPLRQAYVTAINRAILANRTGVSSYYASISDVLDELCRGVSVEYASGHRRRIDSAVKMNIKDGVRKMNFEIRRNQGERFGANGVYIMPHGLCAPDHLPYQGREYTYAEFDSLNEQLRRPIATGTWNCGHVAYDRIIGTPLPYTEAQVKKMNDYSEGIVTWNGNEMTRYEATQKMRQAETNIRRLKDSRRVYEKAGDKTNEMRYNELVEQSTDKYTERCKECGLRARSDLT